MVADEEVAVPVELPELAAVVEAAVAVPEAVEPVAVAEVVAVPTAVVTPTAAQISLETVRASADKLLVHVSRIAVSS